MAATKCVACRQGFIWECRQEGKCDDYIGSNELVEGETSDGEFRIAGSSDSGSGIDGLLSGEDEQEVDDPNEKFTTYKDDSNLRDQQSTGRKRAAKMFPLDFDASCEWQMRKNCGGGNFPITGCIGGLQQARHHGPEKNTLNNDKGNVHRICHTCHNRWHTLNDEGYVWTDIQNPHEPRTADAMDVAESEEFWLGRKLVKAKD